MVELKTFKNLKLPKDMMTQNPLGYRACEVLIEEIKEEAIKWIKEIKEKGFDDWVNSENSIPSFLGYFFNITEEDLT